MRLKLATACSSAALASTLFAQPFSSRHDFSGAGYYETGWTIARLDAAYVIFQGGHIPANGFQRACVTAVSSTGLINEVVSYGRDSLTFDVGNANGVSRTTTGQWLIGGANDNGDRVGSLLWKLNATFDSLWSFEIFPSQTDQSLGRSARYHSGRYYVSGGVWHPGNQGQMFLAALDTNGVLLWTHEYGTAVRDEAYSLDTVQDGGLIIGGTHWSSADDWQGYVVKVDPEGTALWHRYLGGPFQDSPLSVTSTRLGNVICVGTYATYQQGGTTKQRLYVAQLLSDGSVDWQRQYAGQSEVNYLSSATELHDGSFIAPGAYAESGTVKGVLLHLAENGDSLWMRTYQHPPIAGPNGIHWLQHGIEDSDGSIVATGSCNDGQQDLWVIRVDSCGCLVPGCQLFDHVAQHGDELHVALYPNPVRDRLAISFRSGLVPTGTFELLDLLGKVVRRFAPGGKSEEIDLDMRPHPAGMYLLRYTDANGSVWEEKVVKE